MHIIIPCGLIHTLAPPQLLLLIHLSCRVAMNANTYLMQTNVSIETLSYFYFCRLGLCGDIDSFFILFYHCKLGELILRSMKHIQPLMGRYMIFPFIYSTVNSTIESCFHARYSPTQSQLTKTMYKNLVCKCIRVIFIFI